MTSVAIFTRDVDGRGAKRETNIWIFMGPGDLKFKTWYPDKARLGENWEREELKVVHGKRGWAGWVPKSEEERQKFECYVQRALGLEWTAGRM